MTQEDKKLLLALSIGDGHLYRPVDKRKLRSEFRVNHSHKQKDYLEWKKQQVERILDCKINTNKQSVSAGFEKKYDVVFFSKVSRYFAILRKYLYRSGTKEITEKVFKRINTLGLAIIYLDDGNIHQCKDGFISLEIALGCSEGQAKKICDVIYKRWGVKMYGNKMPNSKFYRIRCRTKEGKKFLDIVRPYVLNEIQTLQHKVTIS